MRTFKKLSEYENKTILISIHNLLELYQTLYGNGVVMTKLAVYETNLEAYFMDVTGGNEHA